MDETSIGDVIPATLVNLLSRLVPDNICQAVLSNESEMDELVRRFKLTERVTFLWVKASVKDPIYRVWLLHKEKVFTDDCHVVFTGINVMDGGWGDLVDAFGGTRFANLFVMRIGRNARPKVYPTQRGIYLK